VVAIGIASSIKLWNGHGFGNLKKYDDLKDIEKSIRRYLQSPARSVLKHTK
jgi:hypothetical protein